MPYKDPEKKREADRLRAAARRKEKKLRKLQGKTKPEATVKVSKRKTRVTKRSEALSDEDLDGLDLEVLTLGKLAISKALHGLEALNAENLDPIDIKRLGEFGIQLVKAAQESLEGRQVKEEEDVSFVAKVHENPEAQDHVHGLLQLMAADDLAKEIPKPGGPPTEGT